MHIAGSGIGNVLRGSTFLLLRDGLNYVRQIFDRSGPHLMVRVIDIVVNPSLDFFVNVHLLLDTVLKLLKVGKRRVGTIIGSDNTRNTEVVMCSELNNVFAIAVAIVIVIVPLFYVTVLAMRQRRRNVSIGVRKSTMEANRFDILNGGVEPVVVLVLISVVVMMMVVVVAICRGVQMVRVRIGRVTMCNKGGVREMRRLRCTY